jgi:DNA-binding Lrp family transcriptional regulator
MPEQLTPPDALDKALLNALMDDGRKSMQALSEATGLSRSAVFARVKRLENQGIIEGYTARIDRKKLGLQIRAFCNVQLKQHDAQYLTKFEARIGDFKEVKACYHIAGSFDYLLAVFVEDMNAYHDFIARKLAAMDNIGTVQSSFVMSEVIER